MDSTEQVLDTPGPVIEHERPALDPTPVVDDGKSELQRHKETRGYVKPSEPDPEPPPVPEAAAEAVAEPEPEKKPERWNDPDTGDVYDMRHKVARRIKKVLEERAKVTDRAERAERERDELLRRMAERPSAPSTPQAETPVGEADPEPDPADTAKYPEGQFDRGFIRDQAKWAARAETRAALQTARTESDDRARQAAESQVITQWQQTALPEAIKKYPNFEQVLGSIPNTPENTPIVRLMFGSPVGTDLVYVLGTNPEAMDAYRRAPSADHRLRLLYHLEAQLIAASRSTPAKPSTTRAPQPTTPVNAAAGPAGPIDWTRTDDPDQLSRWKAMRKR